MNKKAAAILPVIATLFIINPVFAQDSLTSSNSSAPSTIRQKAEVRTTNIENRVNNKIANISTRGASKEANIQGRIEQRREKEASYEAMAKNKIEMAREKIASMEANFRQKIQSFKDKNKAEIANRVNTNLNQINKNQTNQMSMVITKLSAVLDKLDILINQNSSRVKDLSGTNQAITAARTAIAATKTAVDAEAQTDYTIPVTTEANIKTSAKTQREKLYKDITAVRKLLMDARKSVEAAVKIARTGSNSATESSAIKEGTASGQQ